MTSCQPETEEQSISLGSYEFHKWNRLIIQSKSKSKAKKVKFTRYQFESWKALIRSFPSNNLTKSSQIKSPRSSSSDPGKKFKNILAFNHSPNMITTQTLGETPKTSPERSQVARRNVKSILWNKFLDLLENSTFRQIISVFLLIISSLVLTLLLTYTKQASEAVWIFLKFNNYIFPKAVGSFLIVFNFRNILDLAK